MTVAGCGSEVARGEDSPGRAQQPGLPPDPRSPNSHCSRPHAHQLHVIGSCAITCSGTSIKCDVCTTGNICLRHRAKTHVGARSTPLSLPGPCTGDNCQCSGRKRLALGHIVDVGHRGAVVVVREGARGRVSDVAVGGVVVVAGVAAPARPVAALLVVQPQADRRLVHHVVGDGVVRRRAVDVCALRPVRLVMKVVTVNEGGRRGSDRVDGAAVGTPLAWILDHRKKRGGNAGTEKSQRKEVQKEKKVEEEHKRERKKLQSKCINERETDRQTEPKTKTDPEVEIGTTHGETTSDPWTAA